MSTQEAHQEDGFIRQESGNGRPERVSFLDVFAGIVGFETSLFPCVYGSQAGHIGRDKTVREKAIPIVKKSKHHYKKMNIARRKP